MKLRFFPLVAGALLVVGCGWHELGRPIGTGLYGVTAPTGVVTALGEAAPADVIALGVRCEASDIAACTQVAAMFRDGVAALPVVDAHGGGEHGAEHGGDHAEASGDAAHGEAAPAAHGEPAAHGDDHGGHGDHAAAAPALGWAVTPDAAKAAELFATSCDAGWPASCLALAHAHHDGAGVAHDEARAHALMAEACEHGLSEACLDLAGLLEHDASGHGEAIALYETACQRNVAAGCVGRDRLAAGH
jgi:TPR repeat protein